MQKKFCVKDGIVIAGNYLRNSEDVYCKIQKTKLWTQILKL